MVSPFAFDTHTFTFLFLPPVTFVFQPILVYFCPPFTFVFASFVFVPPLRIYAHLFVRIVVVVFVCPPFTFAFTPIRTHAHTHSNFLVPSLSHLFFVLIYVVVFDRTFLVLRLTFSKQWQLHTA